ncbi:DeoR family fructose operon transcriptional repressor [Evansella vedderi]|uniref:DeoR family fructose operon transcriptional repressor n=1 Tax=Evansella vedderi TaxID=38282 RepID=A0ABU0A069_9BACI|nr:DeoR/GlpR family DNA-binding transcription regulator [Evansella vedderi]MDQ0256889.1 DeoR family fructose operon transcriptional repressor [Evansella vedderi]
MLTFERQQLILSLLKDKKVVKLQEIVDATNASESTIRRDLTELENNNQLKRIHGGASLLTSMIEEPTIEEKQSKYTEEKLLIGQEAASIVKDGRSIYIDAGTTTKAMVEYLKEKDIVVVTNGLNVLNELLLHGMKAYILGGFVKRGTHAMVGRGAIDALETYQFDMAFMGTNGLDLSSGYTTPDPEEAQVKAIAIKRSKEAYFLTDHSKFGDTSFAKITDLSEAAIITSDKLNPDILKSFAEKTEVRVVKMP